ncbi:hypothetical protein TNIN_137541, partial [Trichonephila inaurata madagascariensis]
MSPMSLYTPSKRGISIRSGAWKNILNVYSRLREENPQESISEIVRKVSEQIGVSKRTVFRLKKELTLSTLSSLGLYAENHGFVQNMMYDSHYGDFFLMAPNDTASVPHWWDSAEPLWITAEKKGLRSALYWWDGCQVEIRGRKPTFCRKYKYVGYSWPTVNEDTQEALLTALQLLENNEIQLVQIYYEPVDFY